MEGALGRYTGWGILRHPAHVVVARALLPIQLNPANVSSLSLLTYLIDIDDLPHEWKIRQISPLRNPCPPAVAIGKDVVKTSLGFPVTVPFSVLHFAPPVKEP
jgi:hypothetical protein